MNLQWMIFHNGLSNWSLKQAILHGIAGQDSAFKRQPLGHCVVVRIPIKFLISLSSLFKK